MGLMEDALKAIGQLDPLLIKKAEARLDSLTKPRGSLGRLEEFVKKMAAITGRLRPEIKKKYIFTFAADHGVAEEGVSAFPKEVTRQMVFNFLGNGAGINVLARHVGAEVIVIDIGVDFDFNGAHPGLLHKKVVMGSRNMRLGPAMTKEETKGCIEAGIEVARAYASVGAIYGTGEMGIANTTPASAVTAVFTGAKIADVTGRGTGIDDATYAKKIQVIEDAIRVNRPDAADPLGVLAKVGGPEIAGIAGLCIGAASLRIPVVVDGFISGAGALAAFELDNSVKDYLFAAHSSVEKGHRFILERLGLRPFVDLDMRLGEGTGAAIGISLVEAGLKIYNEMATFTQAGVSQETK